MYTEENFINIIIENFPDFQIDWEENLEFWGGDPRGNCNDMSVFSRYVVKLIENGNTGNLKKIFDLIEDFMVNGNSEIQTITATCFLENLINMTPEIIPSEAYIHLLGKKSKKYCIAWDEFTGVKTDGLYDK